MNTNQLIKRSIILVIIFLTYLGLILPSSVAYIETDPDDGVWFDNFDDYGTVDPTNCYVDIDNSTIELNKTTNEIEIDFTDDNSHKAYSYVTPRYFLWRLFPPRFNILREHKLRTWPPEISLIKYKDYDPYPYSSDRGRGNYVIHHFRFKLDIESKYIDKLYVYWRGKALNDNYIKIYYWKYFSSVKIIGLWKELANTTSQDSWKTFNYVSIPEEDIAMALIDNNYLDICVVNYPESTPGTLLTDYVSIEYLTEKGYSLDKASVVTMDEINPKLISNTSSFYWDTFTWSDYEIGNAEIKYHILYNKDGNWTEVENEYIDKNMEGLENPPISLHNLPPQEPYDKIKIRANLSTDSHLLTPKIFNWAVTWQNNPNMWQDLFNYSFRIKKSKVSVLNGNISIDPIIGDWPMFGQNPQNTRALAIGGPENFKINWWCQIGSEIDKVVNPVIIDRTLYTTTSYEQDISKYLLFVINNVSIPSSRDDLSIKYDKTIDLPVHDKKIVNPPTITEDKIIITTGEKSNQGTENYVIALDRAEGNFLWEFLYPENICYSMSPVVYNDKVIVTSWSGDQDIFKSNKNNKVIALELSSGSKVWEYDLPAKCTSTPACYNNTVYVGCKNRYGKSLFAINVENGESVWNASIGVIGDASPVIYNNTVYIVSKCENLKKIKLTALSHNNGTLLWKKTICRSIFASADTTPAIYNDVIYVASPKGILHALDANSKGKKIWEKRIYSKGVLGKSLLTSPAYSNGIIYIGTPAGRLRALSAADGSYKKGWEDSVTFQIIDGEYTDVNPPVITSPIVSNGLVFFGDNNGRLYSFGEFKEPEDQEIEGNIVSIPIKLPEGYWWDTFHARSLTPTGSSISFSILDENKNLIKTIKSGQIITMDNKTLERTIILSADLFAKNITVNPRLLDWKVSFISDAEDPILYRNTFDPDPDGWINKIIPVFSVEVKDNTTGLLVNSAEYVLEYSKEGGGVESTVIPIDAFCSGVNGTKDVQTIIANISSLPFYSNITDLYSITISIKDLAGNKASLYVPLHLDIVKPISNIINDLVEESYNSQHEFIRISATSNDPGTSTINSSGVKEVELLYRYSEDLDFTGSWIAFGTINETSPTWTFTAKEGGGYYELSTIAKDIAGNIEDEKQIGDVSFFFDPVLPTIESFTDSLWFNSTPVLSVEFSDDFSLDTIEYRPNFETEWVTIASDINKKTYESSWKLSQKYWDFMQEGEEYYLYFKVNDSVNNIVATYNQQDALIIIKDVSKPVVDLEIPDIEAEWTWDDKFNISVYADDRNGSNIKSVELWYRYSEDNENWSSWKKYEDEFSSVPFVDTQWEFKADEGNGYYEFYIKAEDKAGNVAISEIFSTGLNIFPLTYVAAMIALIVILFLFTLFLFFIWVKKKK